MLRHWFFYGFNLPGFYSGNEVIKQVIVLGFNVIKRLNSGTIKLESEP